MWLGSDENQGIFFLCELLIVLNIIVPMSIPASVHPQLRHPTVQSLHFPLL